MSRYDHVNRDVESAAGTVRSSVRALDNANKALRASLRSADSYLSQLVGPRQYEKSVADMNLADAGSGAAQSFRDAVKTAGDNLVAAQRLHRTHTSLAGDPDSPGSKLLNALLVPHGDDDEDDGLALVNAVTDTHRVAMDAEQAAMDAKTRADEVAEMIGDNSAVAANTENITELDGRVATNEDDLDEVWDDLYGRERGTEAQHEGLAACEATGVLNVANCADARSRHNSEELDMVNDKLMQKKEHIDNLADHIGVDPVTGEGTGEGGHSRIDMNQARSMANALKSGWTTTATAGSTITRCAAWRMPKAA